MKNAKKFRLQSVGSRGSTGSTGSTHTDQTMGGAIILYIIVIVVIIGYVAVLPLVEGVAKIKKNPNAGRRRREQQDAQDAQEESSSAFTGSYQPPTDNYLDSKVTKKTNRRLKLQEVKREDLPISFVPDIDVSGLKKNPTFSSDDNRDPDDYDYDLDELIREENYTDEQDKLREYQSQFQSETI